MTQTSNIQRFARRRLSLFAFPVALAVARCGGAEPPDPTGTGGSGGAGGTSSGETGGAGAGGMGGSTGGSSGGAAGTTGGGAGTTGGSAGTRGNAGSSGSADAGILDAGDRRDGGANADSTTADRADNGTMVGCGNPTPAQPSCYVAGAPIPTSFGSCLQAPRGLRDIDGMTFRWHNDVFYWRNGNNIVRLKGTTTEAVTLSGDAGGFFDVDDEAVYYVVTGDAGRSIRRTKLDRTETVTIAPDVKSIFALTGDRIYFDTSDGHFVSTSKMGGGLIDAVAGPPSVERLFTTSGVLIDATHLYWNEGTAPDVTLLRAPQGGTTVETVAAHLPAPAALLQGDSVLLVAGNDILEMPKSGGCLLGVVSGAATSRPVAIGSIAADDTAIYWGGIYPSDSSDLLLWRAPRRGGAIVEILVGGNGIRGWPSPPLTPILTPTQVLLRGEGLGGYTAFAVER